MIKRIAIVGLLFAIGGGSFLAWALWDSHPSEQTVSTNLHTPAFNDPNTSKTPRQDSWTGLAIDSNEAIDSELAVMRRKSPEVQAAEKQARLQADMEKLAAGDLPDPDLGEALYGSGWLQTVKTYRKQQETHEIMVTAALVITGFGCLTLVLSLFAGIIRIIVLATRKKKTVREEGLEEKVDDMADSPIKQEVQKPEEETPPPPQTEPAKTEVSEEEPPEAPPARGKLKVDIPLSDTPENEPCPEYKRVFPSLMGEESLFSSSNSKIDNLMSDESEMSLNALNGPIFDTPRIDKPEKTVPPQAPPQPKITAEARPPSAPVIDLEQQIAEVSQKAQAVQEQGETDKGPMNQTLNQLSDQISAIRQFAATQQDRVEKLQSGYDWNIIRTFCLRVIRCIDNLETRIDHSEDDTMVTALSDIHDELLFSLESSGVEQFAPEIKSPFSGQERIAEAVKDKEACTSQDLHGCIAEVIKPGYQYVIDEDNVKIVRTARVKLYRVDDPSA